MNARCSDLSQDSKMEEHQQQALPPLSQEQREILDTCPHPHQVAKQRGQLTRITAAAGAGKTTTLLALAAHAVELGHDHLTYVTFTNAAANDGKERLNRVLSQRSTTPTIEARTLHSSAMRLLHHHLQESTGNDDKSMSSRPRLWSEKSIKRWISDTCQREINSFLGPCSAEIARTSKTPLIASDRQTRCREKAEFFIFKSLHHFCQSSWTLAEYRSGKQGGRDFWGRDYYPIKLFHDAKGKGHEYGFPTHVYKPKIGFYADQAARLWKLVLEGDIRSFNFEMKRAQLLKLRVPGSILLVDESQDMDACQVDWIVKQQVEWGTHVYVVGDAAQAIYGFRGAKPQYLMQLQCDNDRMLTESWRFGPAISKLSNLVLYAKEMSEQTAMTYDGKYKNWIPYRTRPGNSNMEGKVTEEPLLQNWKSRKVTVIARSNATLLLEALNVLGFKLDGSSGEASQADDQSAEVELRLNHPNHHVISQLDEYEDDFVPMPEDEEAVGSTNPVPLPEALPKIHINGRGEGSGINLWKKTFQLVKAAFQLYKLQEQDPHVMSLLDERLFPDFARKPVNWKIFCDECTEKELTKYTNVIAVISRCESQTLQAVELFQKHVTEQRFSAQDADIILTTCHAAKGMEWDSVVVCDDFTDLKSFKQKKATLGRHTHHQLDPRTRDVALSIRGSSTLVVGATSVLDVPDEIHQRFLQSQNGGVNTFGVAIPGCEHPLNEEQAVAFYVTLVLPLRDEVGISRGEALKPELVESPPTCSDEEPGGNGE